MREGVRWDLKGEERIHENLWEVMNSMLGYGGHWRK